MLKKPSAANNILETVPFMFEALIRSSTYLVDTEMESQCGSLLFSLYLLPPRAHIFMTCLTFNIAFLNVSILPVKHSICLQQQLSSLDIYVYLRNTVQVIFQYITGRSTMGDSNMHVATYFFLLLG